MRNIASLTPQERIDFKKVINTGFVFGKSSKRRKKTAEDIDFVFYLNPDTEKYIFQKQYNAQILKRYYINSLDSLRETKGKANCRKIVQISHVIIENGCASIWSCSEDFLP